MQRKQSCYRAQNRTNQRKTMWPYNAVSLCTQCHCIAFNFQRFINFWHWHQWRMNRFFTHITWVLLLCSRNHHHEGGIHVVAGLPTDTPAPVSKQSSLLGEGPSTTKDSVHNDDSISNSDILSREEILDVVIIGAGWAGIGAGRWCGCFHCSVGSCMLTSISYHT